MAIKKYKPTTPGRRKASVIVDKSLSKKKPEKALLRAWKSRAGRNSQGRITVRHRGGGAKRRLRVVDFKRDKYEVSARVQALEYDPNRTARLALLLYEDGERRYMIAPEQLRVGDRVVSSRKATEIEVGNRMPLKYIPAGTVVHAVELYPGQGAKIARSAGEGLVLMGVEGAHAQLKMPSTEIRLVPAQCMATIGNVGNPEHTRVRIGKAGRTRHLGVRPTVRGKAMNPVDHRHGGGEGKHPIGLKRPVTPWGKAALGVKTRRNDKKSDRLILKRRRIKRRK